jgi:hypothetical protein
MIVTQECYLLSHMALNRRPTLHVLILVNGPSTDDAPIAAALSNQPLHGIWNIRPARHRHVFGSLKSSCDKSMRAGAAVGKRDGLEQLNGLRRDYRTGIHSQS